nr:Dual specificity protein kinase [Ipomoea batatas]
MPTFTSIALENLLEPRVRDSYKKPLDSNQIATTLSNRGEEEERVDGAENAKPQAPNHIYISPALYITPEPAPIPDTLSASISPSPYVANRKRRSGGGLASRKIDGFEVSGRKGGEQGEKKGDEVEYEESDLTFQCIGDVDAELAEDDLFGTTEVGGDRIEGLEARNEECLDPKCDVSIFGSASEARGLDCQSFASAQGDFFDASEEFSDGSVSSVPSFIIAMESELQTTKLQLLQEIEKRKAAEDDLNMMCNQWQRISNVLSEAGLTLPLPSAVIGGMQIEPAAIENLLQEVIVARFVAEVIGKGQSRAEAELATEAILESKNQEISRLRDRLLYYETANWEMSERNQEIIDAARKQRQRRRTQQKWLWSCVTCVGLSAIIGISVAAYSYLPQLSNHQLTSRAGDSTAGDTHLSS